ncbi:hypothetical protein N7520_002332 [Penicillium odoratum]|uniref:uncharacterized protein n=1 Tax=Penicillium odoratum TaxID=1167516 RepID=UPI0025487DEC|nr:uncharacterized protein N7520_002332 [Penicillium odoratum]KAJ5771803.1 hypothetical protein N7520_002332 [Penicillium odoratum]
MIQLLCASGATPEVMRISVIQKDQGRGSLWSSSNIKILSLLLELGADPETFVTDGPRGFPLISAASEGEVEAVGLLLDAEARPDLATLDFGTALQAAAARGHEVVVRILIERGAGNREHAAFKTPIQFAASGDHIGIVQTLLQSGALVNYCPSVACFGLPEIDKMFSRWDAIRHFEEIPLAYPVQYAAMNQNVTLLQQLLAAGANVDSRIAIQAAAESGSIEIMKLLLDAKADINADSGWRMSRTALQAAIERRHKAAVTFLLKSGADINAKPAFKEGMTALQAAAMAGEMEIFQMALKHGAHVNAPAGPESGLTVLKAIIKHENLASLKIVLQAGADVNERSSNANPSLAYSDYIASDKSPLQYAAYLGWLDGVQCLLDWGSDIDAPPLHSDYKACSALGFAIGNDNEDVTGLLLRNGADPNTPACNYEHAPSAFILALSRGCSTETIELFQRNNADITSCWGTESALEISVSSHAADVVEMIINLMSQLPAADFGWKPNYDIVKMLLQAGADTNATDPDTQETLLQKSNCASDFDVVKLLLEHVAEVNIPATKTKGTPLQDAILIEQVEIAQLLLEHGADINAPPSEEEGATALQAAALHGYYSLVLRLLRDGADVAAAPSAISGRTAIDGAAENGRLDILQLLLNAYRDRLDLALVCSDAASVAELEGHTGIASFLRTYKAP